MTIRYIEVRSNGSWYGAAKDIIKKLTDEGVQNRQIISIDAHSNGQGEAAIFSAMWDDSIQGKGTLHMGVAVINRSGDTWEQYYDGVRRYLIHDRPENIISITGSCNVENQNVMNIFRYYAGVIDDYKIYHCEVRGGDCEGVAEQLISNLKDKGVKAGQIISIDAHSNGVSGELILHAFWHSALPALGDLDIKFSVKKGGSWDSHYQWAANCIASGTGRILGVTSTVSSAAYGATFIFRDDAISQVTS